MVAANPKTVLVLINGGPLAIEAEAASVPAIVECFYPGQLGGEAIVDALMGDVNVFGKMPYTTYFANFVSHDHHHRHHRRRCRCCRCDVH